MGSGSIIPNPSLAAQLDVPALPCEPSYLRAGDSWQWQRAFDDYRPSDGWSLTYILNAPFFRFAFPDGSVTASADGNGFIVSLTSTQTAAIVPSVAAQDYTLYAVLTNGGQVVTSEIQPVTVDVNIATAATAVDTRSQTKKTLDAIRAAIAGDLSPHVAEYTIHGRMLKKYDKLQLEKLLSIYVWRYERERERRGEFVPKRQVGYAFKPLG